MAVISYELVRNVKLVGSYSTMSGFQVNTNFWATPLLVIPCGWNKFTRVSNLFDIRGVRDNTPIYGQARVYNIEPINGAEIGKADVDMYGFNYNFAIDDLNTSPTQWKWGVGKYSEWRMLTPKYNYTQGVSKSNLSKEMQSIDDLASGWGPGLSEFLNDPVRWWEMKMLSGFVKMDQHDRQKLRIEKGLDKAKAEITKRSGVVPTP